MACGGDALPLWWPTSFSYMVDSLVLVVMGCFFSSYHLSSPLMSVSVAHRKVECAEFRFRSAALCAVDGCGYLNLKPVQGKS